MWNTIVLFFMLATLTLNVMKMILKMINSSYEIKKNNVTYKCIEIRERRLLNSNLE